MTEITTHFQSDPLSYMEDRNVEDFQFYNEDFSNLTIEDKHFISGTFRKCNFTNTNFKKCSFGGISFIDCEINCTSFDACDLGATFSTNTQKDTKVSEIKL